MKSLNSFPKVSLVHLHYNYELALVFFMHYKYTISSFYCVLLSFVCFEKSVFSVIVTPFEVIYVFFLCSFEDDLYVLDP